jgi:hypothetical protein
VLYSQAVQPNVIGEKLVAWQQEQATEVGHFV